MGGRSGPERSFEVVEGKVLAEEAATRFPAVREGAFLVSPGVQKALIQAGCTNGTEVAMFPNGDVGLRVIQNEVVPKAEYILDWFHLRIRFQNVIQVARGLSDSQILTIVKLRAAGV